MSDTNKSIEIQISKTKVLLLILGCLTFVVLSLWLWNISDHQVRRSPTMMKIVSILGVSFFGLGLVVGAKKLFDKRPGLIVNDSGIQNNLGIGKGLFVSWKNMDRIEIVRIKSTQLLLIFVNNADEIINAESKWKQKIMRYSLKSFGTPISIGSGALKMEFVTLAKLLFDKHDAAKKIASH